MQYRYIQKNSSGYALLRVDFLTDCDCRGCSWIRRFGRRISMAGQGIFPFVFNFIHRFVSATKKALTTAINLQRGIAVVGAGDAHKIGGLV